MARVVLEYGEYYLIVTEKEADEIRKMERFIPIVEVNPFKPNYIGNILGFYVLIEQRGV